MLMVNEETGDRRPVIRCGHCWNPVERGEEGLAVWVARPEDPSPPYFEVRFVHVGCLEGYATRERAGFESMALGAFVRDLALNLKVPEDEGRGEKCR